MFKKKPVQFLYAGSDNLNIKLFEPRGDYTLEDKYVGKVVFATQDMRYASIYTFRWEQDDAAHFSLINKKYSLQVLKKAETRLLKPCAIYSFDPQPFELFDDLEWYTKAFIQPIKKKVYSSVLRCLEENKITLSIVEKLKII